jgi:ketosteroid isomerase-like protein
MSERNVDLVRAGIDAFNRRDFDAALAALRDEVTWERFLSRAEADTPVVRGKEELRAVWASQVEAVDLRVEPEEFIPAGDDKVIVPSRMVAHGSGSDIPLSAPVTWMYTIGADGLASKVEAFESRAAALEAAGHEAHAAGDPEAIARRVIDSNQYMALGTADPDGVPWVSPLWYAPVDYREFLWVSAPEARHSLNIAERAEVAIVIYDSQEAGGWNAVYITATASELSGAELERGIALFSRRSVDRGLREWTADDVSASAKHRLFRALASEQFVLSPDDERIPVRV